MPRLVTLGSAPRPSTSGRSSRYQATMRGIPLSRGLTRPTTTGTIARSRTLVYRCYRRLANLTASPGYPTVSVGWMESWRTDRDVRASAVAMSTIVAAPMRVGVVPMRSAVGPTSTWPRGMAANDPSTS